MAKTPDIVWTAYEEIGTDTENESANMIEWYEKATDQEKIGFDHAILYLTGWSLQTLIELARMRGNYVEQ
jgi:hypothetical protein